MFGQVDMVDMVAADMEAMAVDTVEAVEEKEATKEVALIGLNMGYSTYLRL